MSTSIVHLIYQGDKHFTIYFNTRRDDARNIGEYKERGALSRDHKSHSRSMSAAESDDACRECDGERRKNFPPELLGRRGKVDETSNANSTKTAPRRNGGPGTNCCKHGGELQDNRGIHTQLNTGFSVDVAFRRGEMIPDSGTSLILGAGN
jgi:hypothetical protein